MKMWSGRFRQSLDPAFERWQRSFDFDRRLLKYEVAASTAHAQALKEAGVLSSDELISICEGLAAILSSAVVSAEFANGITIKASHLSVTAEGLQGLGITIITIGLMSLGFMSFSGIQL